MYRDYWQLQRAPFENVNDPSFMFQSGKHCEALARLRYAVEQKKQGALLLGQYGTGKTYLGRVLRRMSEGPACLFVQITNPRISAEEFINEVYVQLGFDVPPTALPHKSEQARAVQSRLKEMHDQGRHVAVIVDEAQCIAEDELLDEIRLLLNMQGDDANHVTLILLGQPQFKEIMERAPQLKQRLSVVYTLDHLDASETAAYVLHRLSVAGASRDIFDGGALAEVYAISQGMPRAVNNLCDLALLHGFVKKLPLVTAQTVREAGTELGIASRVGDAC